MRGGVVTDMSSTCVQGGLPRPLGGYQPNLIMEPHSPAPAWQLHHPPIIPKQEPIDEDRNDSGINSGSDFHSSSPGSENSQEISAYYPSAVTATTTTTTTNTPLTTPRIPSAYSPSPMGYHPPNPSKLQGLTIDHHEQLKRSTSQENPMENEDPLKKLQYTFEKNGLVSPASPKTTSEHSVDDDNKSDLDGDEFDEQGLRIPRMNSHGKVKTFRCKQCEFVAITKLDFWEHSKCHIKADKLLTCPKCPFVTEYKHHLEYHLRNHFGSKPFKCDKCSYSCVNKSMLNSHMKSHSNIYQYRCDDCSYATKYCHSLKLHLRKYAHKPAMVLNPDGTPNPLPIIDVYGTRRGPKQRSALQKLDESDANQTTSALQNQFTHFMMNAATPQMQLPFPYHFLAGFPNPMLFPPNLNGRKSVEDDVKSELCPSPTPTTSSSPQPPEVLDLSKPETTSPSERPPLKNRRRKGRAFKLQHLKMNESSEEDQDVEDHDEEVMNVEEEVTNNNNNNNNNNSNNNFSCQYCNISFGDIVLYTMHMGYHGFKDPFTCNMCGEQCKDKVSFFLHIARNPHT